jgi:prefoldin subunit 5
MAASPSSSNVELIHQFSALKKRREELSNLFTKLNANVEAAQTRYQAILDELHAFGIGSLDELRSKITEVENKIHSDMQTAVSQMNYIQEQMNAITSKEASSPDNVRESR